MNIYKIAQDKEEGIDCAYFFIIAANNEKEVRELAKSHSGDEGTLVWSEALVNVIGIYTADFNIPHVIAGG